MTSRHIAALLPLLVAGCAAPDADEATSAEEVNAAANTDVQVISASSDNTIHWGMGGPSLDARKCTYFDKEPYPNSREFNFRAKADCTDALAALRGATINRYVEPLVWIREDSELRHAAFRHWCSSVEVVVAVKADAWDSPAFEGIGFYARAAIINDRPEDQRVFYRKDDPRLVRVGDARLKREGGQRAYLYKFAGAGPCEVNGTGSAPRGEIEFKPYVSYDGDHERWEAVAANHTLRHRQGWDRRDALLE
jgi:hypothetical protein